MGTISKEQAVEIAIRHAHALNLAEFTVEGVYHSEEVRIRHLEGHDALLAEDERGCQDEEEPRWNVILWFSDDSDAVLGLPCSVTVHVNASTGEPWTNRH